MHTVDHRVIAVLGALCDEVGTPFSSAVKAAAESGEWAKLQSLRTDPSNYEDAEAYWRDTMCSSFLRKCDLPTSVDKESNALSTFWACEAQNALSNARLSRYLPENLLLETPEDMRILEFISEVRKEVAFALGYLPLHLTPRFSQGATYADVGRLTSIPDKMSSRPTIYSHTLSLQKFFWETSWGTAFLERGGTMGFNAYSSLHCVRSNVFFTVPKDGTKFRGCCKEASVNVSLQLDVGRLLALRSRRIGLNKSTAQEAHVELARYGSKSGTLATIDLSNASDTLCRVLPRLLLPGPWFELLDSLRASHTRVWDPLKRKKVLCRLEKFSSMGNGFTFELETLIFACIARCVCRNLGLDPDRVSVFGDDTILPTEAFDSCIAAFSFFGFTSNKSKSFGKGPFRESCGGDFFEGIPVRGFFLEELPNEPQQWIALVNGLRRVAKADGASPSRSRIISRAVAIALGAIPSDIRSLRGPAFLGDIVIHDDDQEGWQRCGPPRYGGGRMKNVRSREGHEQFFIKAYVPVPRVLPWSTWIPPVQLACCTLATSAGVTRRGDVEGYRIGKVCALPSNTWVPVAEPHG